MAVLIKGIVYMDVCMCVLTGVIIKRVYKKHLFQMRKFE